MSGLVAWIAAEAERPKAEADGIPPRRGDELVKVTLPLQVPTQVSTRIPTQGLVAHQFPARVVRENASAAEVTEATFPLPAEDAENGASIDAIEPLGEEPAVSEQEEREQRVYRGRAVTMVRRYMRYSIETGRLPSMLGTEFFRAKVTAYTVVTFEDRVIFVHDMEKCLGRLDEFSRQLIGRHIMQEHDQAATGRLLGCTERTVRTYIPIALDLLSEILLEVGLMRRIESNRKNSCQGGKSD